MSFECAVRIDGDRGHNPKQGDTTYLRVLTFCEPHQEAFEELVIHRQLLMEVTSAQVGRTEIGKMFADLARTPRLAAETPPRRRDMRYEATVYFFRCERYIKIGYSIDPIKRLRAIRSGDGTKAPDGINSALTVLLNTETGGFDRERELHAQFAHLRHTGEWFTEAPELTEYIESLSEAAA